MAAVMCEKDTNCTCNGVKIPTCADCKCDNCLNQWEYYCRPYNEAESSAWNKFKINNVTTG